MTQTRSVRQSFTQSADADGRGSSYTARSMTGTVMLLVRGLPLRVLGRQMRHGRKGCGRTDKEKLRGASRRQHTQERRGVCVYPPARVGCSVKSLVAEEVSQHRHRSFRLVIASLQIGPTAQRRAQLKHLETTLRTPPAHTHRLRADRQRQATRRQQETTQATEAR